MREGNFDAKPQIWEIAKKDVHVTLPVLATLLGYVPWSRFSAAEDLPKHVALEWAGWCRNPRYLSGDTTLPLARYAHFAAPVVAYSFDDDDWGTPQAVNAMMAAYPHVTQRHVPPADKGLDAIGYFGFFRPAARVLWEEVVTWLAEVQMRS